LFVFTFFFQAEDGIRDDLVTGVQTCALPIFHFLNPRSENLVMRKSPTGPVLLAVALLCSLCTRTGSATAVQAPQAGPEAAFFKRSEERRVGKECMSGCGVRRGTERARRS